MGYWRTITLEGKPKFWDKPNCRWKLSPLQNEGLINFEGSHADYDEVNADPDTEELIASQAVALTVLWGNPPWVYPTPDELYYLGYCSVADLRDKGVFEEQATEKEIKKAIAEASQRIDSFCSRNFWRRQETYRKDGDGTAAVFFDDRPIISISSLREDGGLIFPDDYALYSDAGYIRLIWPDPLTDMIFPVGNQNIEVTGLFGFEIIPSEVRLSCIELSIEILRTNKAGVDLSSSSSTSTRNAIGLKRAKVEDISVEFEYPKSLSSGSLRSSTGNSEIDGRLLKFRKDLDVMVV